MRTASGSSISSSMVETMTIWNWSVDSMRYHTILGWHSWCSCILRFFLFATNCRQERLLMCLCVILLCFFSLLAMRVLGWKLEDSSDERNRTFIFEVECRWCDVVVWKKLIYFPKFKRFQLYFSHLEFIFV